MEGRLVLCDIDGTLIDAKGAGLEALREAGREVFGGEGPPLNLCGATDGGIVRDYFSHFGEEYSEVRVQEFYRTYLLRLEENFSEDSFEGVVLPGVPGFLEVLQDRGACLSLLTGNIARGAQVKVRHFGLDQFFAAGAYGDDHHDRNELGPIALARASREFGKSFEASHSIVLGDTPKDIQCAKRIGALAVCVSTGSFQRAELLEAGADLVFDDLSNHQDCLAALESTGEQV